jgi:hydroxyacid-oxoacid transhydrogenase
VLHSFAYPHETVVPWQVLPLRIGLGATREIGYELAKLGVQRALIVTDENVAQTGLPAAITEYAAAYGIDCVVWTGSQLEPTDAAILRGLDDLDGTSFDGYIGVGGGSCIDTAKLLNLLLSHPAPLTRYLAHPHGEGVPIPGPLAPMIGVPTTAGTGSECTPMAVVDLHENHVKAAVSNEYLRPRLAIIDPLNTVSAPPSVTASAGYDALVQALESYTSTRYDRRPAAGSPGDRPVYVGSHPLSELFCEKAIELSGRFLRRAVFNGHDLEAREGMSQAALYSRLGNAGVHIPHANAYAVAGHVHDYEPAGYTVDRPVVPHGQSVVVTAAASFEWLYPAAPDRIDRAAELLGAPRDDLAPAQVLPHWLRTLVAETGGPTSLDALGYTRDDVPGMVETALTQQRILVCSPREVTAEGLATVLENSFA